MKNIFLLRYIKNTFLTIKIIFFSSIVITSLLLVNIKIEYARMHGEEISIRALVYETKINLLQSHRAIKDVVMCENYGDVKVALKILETNDREMRKNILEMKEIDISKTILVDEVLIELEKWTEIRKDTSSFALEGLPIEARRNSKEFGEKQIAIIEGKLDELVIVATNDVKNVKIRLNKIVGSIFLIQASLGILLFLIILKLHKNILNRFKEYDIEIHSSHEELERILKSIGDGVIAVDIDKNVTMLNEVAEKMTGWSLEEAVGKSFIEVFQLSHENIEYFIQDPIDEIFRSNEIHMMSNHAVLTSRSGKRIHIEDSAAPIKDINGDIKGAVLIFRDVTEKREQQQHIEYLSFHDTLTGLYNRRFFEKEIKGLDTEEFYPLSIIIGDLNNLKMTNDAFGHLAGDKLIIKAAEILKECCRKGDIIARWGGDEFIILLPKTDIKRTEEIIERIEKTVEKTEMKEGVLSIAFGWDTKNTGEEEIETVFKNAEDFMYKRKLNKSLSVRRKVIDSIMNTLFEKSTREKQHSERVSEQSTKIAEALKLSKRECDMVRTVGLIHDIGKIIVSDRVLDKKGKLIEIEWDEMKRHPEIGYRIINCSTDMSELAVGVLNHHEKWDGSGYPKGLKGENIPKISRIIAIADAYDAMISKRSYKDPISEDHAVKEIIRCAGAHFDPEITRVFVEKVLKRKWEK